MYPLSVSFYTIYNISSILNHFLSLTNNFLKMVYVNNIRFMFLIHCENTFIIYSSHVVKLHRVFEIDGQT
jgi:hypothetical protein